MRQPCRYDPYNPRLPLPYARWQWRVVARWHAKADSHAQLLAAAYPPPDVPTAR